MARTPKAHASNPSISVSSAGKSLYYGEAESWSRFDLHNYWVFKSPHLPASRLSDWIVILSEQISCSMRGGLDAGAKPPTGDNTLGSASSGPNIFPAKSGPSHQNNTSQPTSPPRGAPPPNLHAGEASQRSRFRPGSKAYYNPFDGPPVKGTVVSIQPSQYGELPLFRLWKMADPTFRASGTTL